MKKILLPILLAALWALTSCTFTQYSLAPITLMQEKGEDQISAGVNMNLGPEDMDSGVTGDLPYNLSLGFSYSRAFTDHFSAQIYGYSDLESTHYLQPIFGCFFPIQSHQVVELYGGMGIGASSREDRHQINVPAEEHPKYYLHHQSIFFQANYGWKGLWKNHLDAGFSLKEGLRKNHVTGFQEYDVVKTSNFLEPQLFARVGGEHLKLNLQMGYLLEWNLPEKSHIAPFSFSAGFVVGF